MTERLRSTNAKVRVELGGNDQARVTTDALKSAWPSTVVRHCNNLLHGPMPDSTYEALLAICAWRADRPIPLALQHRRGRPREQRGNKQTERKRARERARSAAMIRLKTLHEAEYAEIYQEERRNEAASTKETA